VADSHSRSVFKQTPAMRSPFKKIFGHHEPHSKIFLKKDFCHANLRPGGGEDDRHVAAGLPASATAPTLCFAIAARRSELVALDMANIDGGAANRCGGR
jgi:hypothetical protein